MTTAPSDSHEGRPHAVGRASPVLIVIQRDQASGEVQANAEPLQADEPNEKEGHKYTLPIMTLLFLGGGVTLVGFGSDHLAACVRRQGRRDAGDEATTWAYETCISGPTEMLIWGCILGITGLILACAWCFSGGSIKPEAEAASPPATAAHHKSNKELEMIERPRSIDRVRSGSPIVPEGSFVQREDPHSPQAQPILQSSPFFAAVEGQAVESQGAYLQAFVSSVPPQTIIAPPIFSPSQPVAECPIAQTATPQHPAAYHLSQPSDASCGVRYIVEQCGVEPNSIAVDHSHSCSPGAPNLAIGVPGASLPAAAAGLTSPITSNSRLEGQ